VGRETPPVKVMFDEFIVIELKFRGVGLDSRLVCSGPLLAAAATDASRKRGLFQSC
jgi:hypothetical protein